jgi:hypothetical protein
VNASRCLGRSWVSTPPPDPPQRVLRSTAAGPSVDHLQCSIPGPPRKLAALKQARLCRSATRPPDPGIFALRGCGRFASAALRWVRLVHNHASKFALNLARFFFENTNSDDHRVTSKSAVTLVSTDFPGNGCVHLRIFHVGECGHYEQHGFCRSDCCFSTWLVCINSVERNRLRARSPE